MIRSELIQFEGKSVYLSYKTKTGWNGRTGYLYAIGNELAMFMPLNTDNTDVIIPFEDIDKVELI